MKTELGDGLVLRTATTDDFPAILQQVLDVHDEGIVKLTESVQKRMADFKPEDTSIVVDSRTGHVVSLVMLLPVTWIIDGTEIVAAEMEMVGTRKEYRRRGLIRMLNEIYEKRAHQRGALIWVIAGIPYFYRMFGYAYAASLGGSLVMPSELVPKLKDGENEPVSIVRVTQKNLDQFLRLRERLSPRHAWYRKFTSMEYDYLDYAEVSLKSYAYNFLIVREANTNVGVFSLHNDEGLLVLADFYLKDPLHTPSVLRYAKLKASELGGIGIRVMPSGQEAIREITMKIARSHFARAYAWYVKIPSVVRFLEAMGPVLTKRLKGTEFSDFTGNLVISNYKVLHALQFENGVLQKVIQGKDEGTAQSDAAFPPDVLTRLLMGYESLDEIQLHEPDVSCSASIKPLMRTLFPRLGAYVEPEY